MRVGEEDPWLHRGWLAYGIIRAATDLLILCHHGVSASWPSEYSIAPDALEKQLRHLLGRGYRPLTLGAALAERNAGLRLVVTFDDACRSVLREGRPVLSRLGVPATVFVPTAFASSREPMAWEEMARWVGTPFEEELACMGWEELRSLQEEGWEIGSHTRTHRNLVSLDDASLAEELRGSREDCEREMGRPCRSLAYPFSAYDRRVKDAARAAGYSSALILDREIAIPPNSTLSSGEGVDSFELLRVGVYRHDGWLKFALKTSRAVRRLRASRLVRFSRHDRSR